MKINIETFLRLDPNFNNDNICASPKVDAIFMTADRSTYVFQGDNYWKLTKDSVAPGYPRKIYQDWRGVPSNIDAAFTWESTRYTFFMHIVYVDHHFRLLISGQHILSKALNTGSLRT